jgi:hypothetical protein
MKPQLILFILFLFIFTSCSDIIDDVKDSGSSTKLTGSTNIPINTVGNKFSTLGFKVNGSGISFNPEMEITKSQDGVNTIHISANLGTDAKLAALNKLIPTAMKDSQGKVNFDLKVKITSEGWLDYSNVDKEPVVLVKYNGKVGDKYDVTTSSGTKIVREITKKSTADDWDYGFMQIKVIKVEQPTTYPGLKKYVLYFNHKFGLVGMEIIAEDGSSVSSQISADMY